MKQVLVLKLRFATPWWRILFGRGHFSNAETNILGIFEMIFYIATTFYFEYVHLWNSHYASKTSSLFSRNGSWGPIHTEQKRMWKWHRQQNGQPLFSVNYSQ